MKHRFFVFDEFQENEFYPNGDLKKQITKVLRISSTEDFLIIHNGKEYLANYNNEKIKLKKILRSEKETISPKIFLIQSIPKNSNLNVILQKCTEVGIDGINFLETSRSISKFKDLNQKKIRHFNIVKEAAEQSNKLSIPKINYLTNLNEFKFNKNDLLLIAYEDEKETNFHDVLKNLNDYERLFLFIGPEGGFSLQEVENAKKLGFISITFGETILRVETASIYAFSIIKYLLSN